MYQDLRELYWWPSLKQEVTNFIVCCLTYQQVKAEYQLPSTGQSKRVTEILKDMLRSCVIDFRGSWEDFLPFAQFAYNNSCQSSIRMAPYEALYGRKCRTLLFWTELRERWVLGPELVFKTEDKVRLIRAHLKAASDRQKSSVEESFVVRS
ncbi:uncharacterized protein LOC128035500 [Gossypium raimondii]|uniref:uncharacterized protein LOC128035500 n=1 Tax=Gossypium raimondii TaxID=29730 RepID=UPI00227CE122|nr:uncharacterized protein LOC128035500 [Gossypium raimondii]